MHETSKQASWMRKMSRWQKMTPYDADADTENEDCFGWDSPACCMDECMLCFFYLTFGFRNRRWYGCIFVALHMHRASSRVT